MHTIEVKACFDLLESLQSSTSNVFPHFAVTLVLYHARFDSPRLIKRLFCDFIDIGYNPLRHTCKFESIMIENILRIVQK